MPDLQTAEKHRSLLSTSVTTNDNKGLLIYRNPAAVTTAWRARAAEVRGDGARETTCHLLFTDRVVFRHLMLSTGITRCESS